MAFCDYYTRSCRTLPRNLAGVAAFGRFVDLAIVAGNRSEERRSRGTILRNVKKRRHENPKCSAEYNVEPAKKIENCTIVIKDSSALLSDLQSEVAVLCSLARLDPATTSIASSAPADCEQNPSDYVNAIADGVAFLSLMV